ncbi:MAG: hypothetical protein WC781_01950 [Candidatus Pacearchaeota archaeon]|jgi:hypothetical protein
MERQLNQIEIEYKDNEVVRYNSLVKALSDVTVREHFGIYPLNGTSVYHVDRNNEGMTMVLIPAVRDYRGPRVIIKGENNAVSNLKELLEDIINKSNEKVK